MRCADGPKVRSIVPGDSVDSFKTASCTIATDRAWTNGPLGLVVFTAIRFQSRTASAFAAFEITELITFDTPWIRPNRLRTEECRHADRKR